MKDNKIDDIRKERAIFVLNIDVIGIGIGEVVENILDLGLSIGKKLIGVANNGKKGKLHIFNSSDRLKNVNHFAPVILIMILVHPDSINSKKKVRKWFKRLSNCRKTVKSARYLNDLLLQWSKCELSLFLCCIYDIDSGVWDCFISEDVR